MYFNTFQYHSIACPQPVANAKFYVWIPTSESIPPDYTTYCNQVINCVISKERVWGNDEYQLAQTLISFKLRVQSKASAITFASQQLHSKLNLYAYTHVGLIKLCVAGKLFITFDLITCIESIAPEWSCDCRLRPFYHVSYIHKV